jgi:hypothetical protein
MEYQKTNKFPTVNISDNNAFANKDIRPDVEYWGWPADFTTQISDKKWRIMRITKIINGTQTLREIDYANDGEFTCSWNERESNFFQNIFVA